MKLVIATMLGGIDLKKSIVEYLANNGNVHANKVLEDYAARLENEPMTPDYPGTLEDWEEYQWFESINVLLKTPRNDSVLVSMVETFPLSDILTDTHWGKLKVVEIPDDVDYYIDTDCGSEIVREKHRTWS